VPPVGSFVVQARDLSSFEHGVKPR
jgi:hypothetical protein